MNIISIVELYTDFRQLVFINENSCFSEMLLGDFVSHVKLGHKSLKENMGLALNHWTILSHGNDYYSKTKTAQQSQTELLLCLLNV